MLVFVRTVLVFILIAFLGGGIFLIQDVENRLPQRSYNAFLTSLDKGEISEVHIRGETVTYTDIYGKQYQTFSPEPAELTPKLLAKDITIRGEPDKTSPFWNVLYLGLPILLIFIAWYSVIKKQQSEEKESARFAKEKIIKTKRGEKQVTFRDVAGLPEAKDELLEIVDFLQNPKKFSRLGAIIPKGILFQGPPGTGKTLLARAIAGEAGVPFYSISGSDFVEMFVGVGASRVRDLFKEAKNNTPCIIFIDEIDAVGGHRASGGGAGGQDERGQTLNALLVEMDGFSTDEKIIVLAATNRPDILDPALSRPGRFDRQINILAPDVKGRLQIIQVHAQKITISPDIDLEKIAQATPGFTGAELASLVNEAAIVAGRVGRKAVIADDFEIAKDRIIMGVERKGLVIGEIDRQTMAYHEAGHAIVAKFLPETDPIHKITIIPRGRALGQTQQLPKTDRHSYSKIYLSNRITTLMGGRVAEELGIGRQTTGAEDDFQQAVDLATKMVCRWGMSPVLGAVSYCKGDPDFLGDQTGPGAFSEETARNIDQEIKKIVDDCYKEAQQILEKERDFLNFLAEMLLTNETLDSEEMEIVYSCTLTKRKEDKKKENNRNSPS
ncbi:MAG: ATP-dependent zinc metalloprotease FtsH [Desulfurivibrionaceae bacterium]